MMGMGVVTGVSARWCGAPVGEEHQVPAVQSHGIRIAARQSQVAVSPANHMELGRIALRDRHSPGGTELGAIVEGAFEVDGFQYVCESIKMLKFAGAPRTLCIKIWSFYHR